MEYEGWGLIVKWLWLEQRYGIFGWPLMEKLKKNGARGMNKNFSGRHIGWILPGCRQIVRKAPSRVSADIVKNTREFSAQAHSFSPYLIFRQFF